MRTPQVTIGFVKPLLHYLVYVSFLALLASICVGATPQELEEKYSNRIGHWAATSSRFLNMTLCSDKCIMDCKTYVTPVGKCFNSDEMFPDDPSWSGLDILDLIFSKQDKLSSPRTLLRTVFQTTDKTCKTSDSDDKFQIPLDVCVGPFGKPRPWGTFQEAVNFLDANIAIS